MSWLAGLGAKLVGEAVGTITKTFAETADELFTSDEERLDKKGFLAKIAQAPHLAQAKVGFQNATHRTLFVAGGRPFILWVCGVSLGMYFIPQFAIASYLWAKLVLQSGAFVPYPVSPEGLMKLVYALIGLGGFRTVEKIMGVTK